MRDALFSAEEGDAARFENLAKRRVSISLHRFETSDSISVSCWILTFDSLGGSHKAVSSCLTRWLHHEAREKKGIVHDMPDSHYIEARVRDDAEPV